MSFPSIKRKDYHMVFPSFVLWKSILVLEMSTVWYMIPKGMFINIIYVWEWYSLGIPILCDFSFFFFFFSSSFRSSTVKNQESSYTISVLDSLLLKKYEYLLGKINLLISRKYTAAKIESVKRWKYCHFLNKSFET